MYEEEEYVSIPNVVYVLLHVIFQYVIYVNITHCKCWYVSSGVRVRGILDSYRHDCQKQEHL